MKHVYQQPEMQWIVLGTTDLLTLSNGGSTNGTPLDWDDKVALL